MIWRLIALDLDGTLLVQQKDDFPASCFRRTKSATGGCENYLATGRSHSEALPYYQQFAVNRADDLL